MADIVPLSEWYPSMHTLWVREGRRLAAPTRVGYTVHHTDGGVGQAARAYARSVAHFHYHTKGWSRPGGYNFQIGADGTIFEMCGWGYVGAHAPGGNHTTIGVSFQGRFASRLPNADQLDSFAWLVGSHDVPNVQHGHRDWSSTSCPGPTLYRALPLDVTQPAPPPEEDDVRYYRITGHPVMNQWATWATDGATRRHVTAHGYTLLGEPARTTLPHGSGQAEALLALPIAAGRTFVQERGRDHVWCLDSGAGPAGTVGRWHVTAAAFKALRINRDGQVTRLPAGHPAVSSVPQVPMPPDVASLL